MSGRPFYITTAIDYVNGRPHLGHVYEKVTADVIARWRRMVGDDVRFQLGTDEHGIKVQKTAEEAGLSPKDYVDSLASAFVSCFDAYGVSYDRFIRTTDPDHQASVIALLETIRENGYLAEGSYEGWYCEGCEAFKTDKDLPGGSCPEHPDRKPKWLEENNLFFRLSAFTQPLLEHIESNPEFIQPDFRRNEILALIRGGLEDISISRSSSSVSWGIPISFRPDSVVYVWFDALINYLTGVGYGSDEATCERYWPTAVHIIGKDISRFHCVIWPAMLLAAGLPLYRTCFAHGWVLDNGRKLSKSSGGGSAWAEPARLAETYGADAVRYFLVSEVTYGRDGEFTLQRFEEVYNAHLANGLGNLLSRSVGMAMKYFGAVPEPSGVPDSLLSSICSKAVTEAETAYAAYKLHEGTHAAWSIITTCNEQIQAREPWKMAKEDGREGELADFLYGVLESLRIACVLLSPVLPQKMRTCLDALGGEDAVAALTSGLAEASAWGGLPAGAPLERPPPLFPRIEASGDED
ncbi:MAG: methionine--tRNA ligase [Myxococcota bacterium]|nr:methionine--tRNA ligase [Myxococcota bacterium]